jgi:hypothetical protein
MPSWTKPWLMEETLKTSSRRSPRTSNENNQSLYLHKTVSKMRKRMRRTRMRVRSSTPVLSR